MANPVNLPGDLIVPGNLRVAGSITPTLARADILSQAALQAFTVPMSLWRPDLDGDITDMSCGEGIFLGSGTVCEYHVSRNGGLIKTEILIDVTGLDSGATAGDIIGVSALEDCHIGKITAAVNGTIVHGTITCIETPAAGDDDIDFYGTALESTGVQDTAVSGLTNEVILLNNGDWAGAVATPKLMSGFPSPGYIYMVSGQTEGAATYSGGIFLIELWGTPTENSLMVVGGTHGTDAPSLQTPDVSDNGGATTYTARGEIALPWEYVASGSVTLRLNAGMLTTVTSGATTVDVEVFESDRDSTSTGDICTTAAASMNSLSFADLDFTITGTNLAAGDLLDVKITVSANDATDVGIMNACIGSIQLLCDVR